MSHKFTLHDWKTNQEVYVEFNDYSHEGSVGESGTSVWWRDEQGNRHSAFVKESPEQINEIMKSVK